MSLKLGIDEKCTGKKLKVILESGVAFLLEIAEQKMET